jgi:hypothetical protein
LIIKFNPLSRNNFISNKETIVLDGNGTVKGLIMRRFLDLKNDLTFKRLFGTEKNKGILLAFLNDIFEGVYPSKQRT